MQGPEGEIRKESPVEQLWERNREERKETNRKLSTRICKVGMRDQVEEKGENEEAKAETCTGLTAVRRAWKERKGKRRELSSLRQKGHGRKKVCWKRKVPKAKA